MFDVIFYGNGSGLVCDPGERIAVSGDFKKVLDGAIRFINPDEPLTIPIFPCLADGCPDYLPEDYRTQVQLELPIEMPTRIIDDRGFVVRKSRPEVKLSIIEPQFCRC